jgi:putative FmdB family regulatory protein
LPVYEYQCPGCSYVFELIRSFSENGTVPCPKCGCDAQRIFSPVPVIFKGSGFYVTDHRGKDNQTKSTINKSESESEKIKSADNKDEAETTSTEETD